MSQDPSKPPETLNLWGNLVPERTFQEVLGEMRALARDHSPQPEKIQLPPVSIRTNRTGAPESIPLPPITPVPFAPDPLVTGPLEKVLLTRQLLNQMPEVARNVGQISSGPTTGSTIRMRRGGMPPFAFEGTNLFGVTDHQNPSKTQIGLNPSLRLDPTAPASSPSEALQAQGTPGYLEALIHELTHSAGGNEGDALIQGTRMANPPTPKP